jgi:hypothetical protein
MSRDLELALQSLRAYLHSPGTKERVFIRIFSPLQLRNRGMDVLTTKCQLTADIMLYILLARQTRAPLRTHALQVLPALVAASHPPLPGEALISYYLTTTLKGVNRFGDHVLVTITVNEMVYILDSYYRTRTFTCRKMDLSTWGQVLRILGESQGRPWDRRFAWAFQTFGHITPEKMRELDAVKSRLTCTKFIAACHWSLHLCTILARIQSFISS